MVSVNSNNFGYVMCFRYERTLENVEFRKQSWMIVCSSLGVVQIVSKETGASSMEN